MKRRSFFALAAAEAEPDLGEADDPVAVRSLGDCDRLADEGLADEDELTPSLDLAAGADAAHGTVKTILQMALILVAAPHV